MSLARILRTASHIPAGQLAERARFIVLRRLYATAPARPIERATRDARGVMPRPRLPTVPVEVLSPDGIDAVRTRAEEFLRGRFTYLNETHRFPVDKASGRVAVDWAPPGTSPLWRYQLQYLGAVLDLVLAGAPDAAANLVAAWIEHHAGAWSAIAWHPYPVSLRLCNMCLAAGAAGGFDALGPGAANLAAVSAAYLHRHFEHDVRGNHLLENARALLIASRSLDGPPVAGWERLAREIIAKEIAEQVLPDGAHFELSPMYHKLVLWRLIELSKLLGPADPLVSGSIGPAISAMRRFLAGVLCPDGEVPLLGDSVRNSAFAPPAGPLLDTEVVSPESGGVRAYPNAGLYIFASPRLWAVFDAGPVCPDYLPAHGQADSLTVEVWCDGACLVGDPGVYAFTGAERGWSRSSRAHSTLTVDDRDTSEVYGSFRIGGRATLESIDTRGDEVSAAVVPWGTDARLSRVVRFEGPGRSCLRLLDSATAPRGTTVRSRLHLHPSTTVVSGSDGARDVIAATPNGRVRITAEHPVRLERGRASRELGLLEPTTILAQDLERRAPGQDLRGGWTITPLTAEQGQ
jgi:uncharacterized heparinase superfamily protein